MKIKNIFPALAILVVLSMCLPAQIRSAQAKSGSYAYANVGATAIRQSIVYQEPKSSSKLLPVSGVVSRFEMLIYARERMLSNLNTYKQAGWNGLSLLYFDVAKNNGPRGLSSLAAQKTPCTSVQKALSVYTNTITMDTGEICRIHDAIIAKTKVDGLSVTEDWFLHKSDGTRYEVSGGGATGAAQYRMNFSNPQYQQYYVNKLRREFQATDSAHLPTGAIGLFLDNVNESWGDIQNLNGGVPPKEFADKAAYQTGMIAFLSAIHTAYPTVPVWGNMTSFSTNEETFTSFKPYLDGAMIEGAFLDWNGAPRSASKIESGNAVADKWGKPLLYVVQGNATGTYHKYTFGLYLLMANEDAYFFFSDQSSYCNYYEIADYQVALGKPLAAREQVSSGVWRRQFQNGTVQVDMNTHVTTFNLTSLPSPTPSLSATSTKTAIPSRTPTPTRTLVPAKTSTPTLIPASTNTPVATVTPPAVILTEGFYDDTDSALTYTPLWTSYNNAAAYGGSLRFANAVGKITAFSFSGRGFSVIYSTNTNQSQLGVYVDGTLVATINQYGAPALPKVWTSSTLADGVHTVTLKQTSAGITTVDAIQIYAGPPPAP
jgi:hypothetical protein